MKRWTKGKIPWIEEICGLDVKFQRSIELNVKNSEAIGLTPLKGARDPLDSSFKVAAATVA